MMEKVLVYAVTAILMGTVTMVAPLMLLKPTYSRTNQPRAIPHEGGGTFYEKGGALERALSPSNLSAAALLLTPSFLFAVGVFVYVKKRLV